MKIGRVSLVAHAKPEAGELRDDLADLLKGLGIDVTDDRPDLVVSLGGDGTMLRAAQIAHGCDVPLLGVNLGHLGYLNEVEPSGARAALERISRGDFRVQERMMLACRTGDEEMVALNEVLVERASRHRLVRLTVHVGEEKLATLNGDGVIVATPTGSTAYALSAGGPIVSPDAECLIVVPVNPHMIFTRPVVLRPDASVVVEVDPGAGSAALSLDGALGGDLGAGSTVAVCRHPRPLHLVRLSGPGFIERLRTKLQLPG